MNNLIKVNEETQTISARELHEKVGSTERFSQWFDRQLQFGFEEGTDFTSVKTFTLVNNGAKRELDDYELSIDMAKEICMVQKNDKAREVRKYLIEVEKAWNTPEQILARALKVADQTIHSLTVRVEEMQPKADFFDAVADSKDAIPMSDVAKVLDMGIGRNKLFEFLRNKGVLMSNNVPYQKYCDNGWFRTVEQKFTVGDEVRISIRTLVYQKGVDGIRKMLIKEYLGIEK